VRAERRKVVTAGVTLRRLVGNEITEADWALFDRCYQSTYAATPLDALPQSPLLSADRAFDE